MCKRLGAAIILCKLLLFCTKDDIRLMMWPLYSEAFWFVCGEERMKLNASKSRRKLTRNIPGRMIGNQLLPGMLWLINWNPIFNCTGLFLPNERALLAICILTRNDPCCCIGEIFAVCML